ncbi:MAG: tetratricopeptide repeat protein, partial [Rhodopirellula sp.]|nr:tetratricopeptide repeat protein [Rhodopirellula sp.]
MSKRSRASKKKHDRDKRKKQKSTVTVAGSRQPTARLSQRLTEAEGLIARRRLHEARELLERDGGKRQRSPELLEMLLYVYQELGDHLMIARTAERLVRLQPGNADGWMMMAQGYMYCGRAAMAANAYRHFLERWPGHENAVKARKAEEIAGDAAAELLTDFGFSEDDFDWLVLHDEILFEISAGEFEDAVSKCRELLKAKPGVVSARNNLVLSLFQLGRGDEARNVSRETVSIWPDNRFAEALNGRIEFLTGFAAEANVVADRIVRDPSDQQDAVAAQVEFLGTLGRDENVLSVVKFAEPIDKDPRCCAVLKHFEAVALMRSGRGAAAHASWKQCLEMDPGYPPATENLHDLNSSGGHAPWPDSIAKWIPKPVIEQFV